MEALESPWIEVQEVLGGPWKGLGKPLEVLGGLEALGGLGGPWRPLEALGGPWRSLEVLGGAWRSLEALGALGGPFSLGWRPLEALGGPWRPLEARHKMFSIPETLIKLLFHFQFK